MNKEQEANMEISKNYPDARIPGNLNVNVPLVENARTLENVARKIMEGHEERNFGKNEPYSDSDYAALSAAHKAVANAHRDLVDMLKEMAPDALQSIANHSSAAMTHDEASKIAEMMATLSLFPGERNTMWRHSMSNIDRFSHEAKWDTEAKNWRKSHEAFLASQKAANSTAFEVGEIETPDEDNSEDIVLVIENSDSEIQKGDAPGHPFRGNQYKTALGRHMRTAAELRDNAESALSPENVAWDGEASAAQRRANIRAGEKVMRAAEAHARAAMALKKVIEDPTPENKAAAKAAITAAKKAAPLAQSHAEIADGLTTSAKEWEAKANTHADAGNFAIASLAKAVADAQNEAATAHDSVRDHSFWSEDTRPLRGLEYKARQAERAYNDAIAENERAKEQWTKKSASRTAMTALDHLEAAELHEGISKQASTSEISEAHVIAAGAHIAAAEAIEKSDGEVESAFALTKSVEAYMMSRTVEKGDTPGHPFHGNQFTDGAGGGGTHTDRAHDLVSGVIAGSISPADAAKQHEQLANDHKEAAKKAVAEGNEKLGYRHTAAASLHFTAAGLAGDLADDEANADPEYPADDTHIYFSAARDAERASRRAENE